MNTESGIAQVGSHRRHLQSERSHTLRSTHPRLAFTKYCFTSSRLYASRSSFHSSSAPALPTLLQLYCTGFGLYDPL